LQGKLPEDLLLRLQEKNGNTSRGIEFACMGGSPETEWGSRGDLTTVNHSLEFPKGGGKSCVNAVDTNRRKKEVDDRCEKIKEAGVISFARGGCERET